MSEKIIYWDIKKGDDKNTGLSPEEAVKTQERVNELLEENMPYKIKKIGAVEI